MIGQRNYIEESKRLREVRLECGSTTLSCATDEVGARSFYFDIGSAARRSKRFGEFSAKWYRSKRFKRLPKALQNWASCGLRYRQL